MDVAASVIVASIGGRAGANDVVVTMVVHCCAVLFARGGREERQREKR